MDRSIAMLVIGLIFGGGIGFVVAAGNGITLDGHDHTAAESHAGHSEAAAPAMDHAHDKLLDVPSDLPPPALKIALAKDPVSGWNLRVDVENFRFTPENSGLAPVDGEGHAHVYVNGAKIARLYGPWMHIASLPKGDAIVMVTLNSNAHLALAINGTAIAAQALVTSD